MENGKVLQLIKRLYQERGWSVYQLSKKTGIPQSTLSTMFKRSSTVSMENIERFCKAFGISCSQFWAMLEQEESSYLTDVSLNQIFTKTWDSLNGKEKSMIKYYIEMLEKRDQENEGI